MADDGEKEIILGDITIDQINEIYNDILEISPNDMLAEGCNISCGFTNYVKGVFGCL